MLLRRELILAIGGLVGLNLLFAFGMIGLLVRMGPAIERILVENVTSVMAGEAMLEELAAAGHAPMDAEARARFLGALDRAKQNVFDPDEVRAIEAIEREAAGGHFEDPAVRRRAIVAIRALIDINRDAMIAVDEEARRQGLAGAWAAVLVGFSSFVFSIFILATIRRRVMIPVLEMHDVLERSAGGDLYRRCRSLASPLELRAIARGINLLLDRVHAPTEPSEVEDAALDLEAFALLLGGEPGPALVVEASGEILHANEAALAALAGPRGVALRAALAKPGEHTAEGATPIRATPSRSGKVYLCRLTEGAEPAP